MRSYGQYCPIARGAEIFAERWTPIIVRNVLLGCETFTAIQRGAPGIPRSLLAERLSMLERHNLIERRPAATGRGFHYHPTEAGRDLWNVCVALGEWGARWLEVAPANLDPYVALWSMCNRLNVDRLPKPRIVVGFRFPTLAGRMSRIWVLIENGRGEVCNKAPGEEDLVVIADPERFIRWHMGELDWAEATADEAIRIEGPSDLARDFPTWNKRSAFADIKGTLATDRVRA